MPNNTACYKKLIGKYKCVSVNIYSTRTICYARIVPLQRAGLIPLHKRDTNNRNLFQIRRRSKKDQRRKAISPKGVAPTSDLVQVFLVPKTPLQHTSSFYRKPILPVRRMEGQ